ncbi:MAG: GAF domain-containing protein [Patescibacteria group bacterium]|nr:GAF domain-containing protein [Patescibacteria group bacterium]
MIELNSKTVFDQEGKFCCVYGVASDQSEEEKIQKALKSERDLLAKTNKDLLLSYQAIGRINAQISSLIEVNTTFSSAMPWGEKVEYLFHSIAQFIKADLGSLRVWNQQQEEMVQFAEYIADEGKQEFLEKARKARSFKEMYIQCIDQKKVVRIDDTNLNKNYECYEISKKYNIESVIFVPVILSGEVYGAMGFYLHNRKLSQDINHKILMLYSSQVAIGLLLSGDLDDTISKL